MLIRTLWVNREGLLFPAGPVTVPRDLLTPLEVSQFTLGTVDSLDEFLTKSKLTTLTDEEVADKIDDEKLLQQESNWQLYVKHCGDLYQYVCNKTNSDSALASCYIQPEYSFVVKSEQSTGMSTKILELYDSIIAKKPELALFKSYASRQICDFDDCIKPEKSTYLRNGHSSNLYALADAQRDALTHALCMQDGDILAVNGPPGTGKTTYVLSVVASMWVDAALKQTNAPVIFAASTNNQAVTNIIDAFGKDFSEGEGPLSGRWLPDINSYGAYFPSRSRQDEAQKKFQTKTFFESVEDSDYLEQAEHFFLEKAKQVSDAGSVEDIRHFLHSQLTFKQSQLKEMGTFWSELCQVREQVLAEIGENPELTLGDLKQSLLDSEQLSQNMSRDGIKWKQFLASESFWLTTFSWMKSIRKKRNLKRELYLSEHLSKDILDLVIKLDTDDVEQFLINQQSIIDAHSKNLANDYNNKQSLLVNQIEIEHNWVTLAQSLDVPVTTVPSFDVVDKQADTQIRFVMFRLAVHYWEASWLIESKKLGNGFNGLKKKTGMSTVIPRWQRRMMLTPCIVSTFHSLPSLITGTAFNEGNFEQEHIFNFIDLLIVDEAGQVSPEVAGAAFALAKKSLVIGDIHQIEPVRSITGAIDVGNLFAQNILTTRDDYDTVLNNGRSVVSGSVMHIAQSASRFQYQDKMESGMYLREHRRCFDEIIMFCNDLCYKGVLLPMRGGVSKDVAYPAFGYLHIDGKAEQRTGGSRFNSLEAETIASWLEQNREKLEAEYNDKVENIVGIVTPFKAQVNEIENQCTKLGIKVGKNSDELTVGTVHALQGAERKVIIFSPVYTRHNNGGFIDSSQSMLNVAVSRAKDSFLVFGDMDVMASCASSEPRGVLAKYLFDKDENELFFVAKKRSDLLNLCREPRLINNAKEHDEYIIELLSEVNTQITIVSPWVQLAKLESTGILNSIKATLGRNVVINFYTDRHFNTTTNNKFDGEKERVFVSCCEYLASLGVCVSIIKGVHSKLIMADGCHISVGSFNWFSAVRSGVYANMETSFVYTGELKSEIKTQMEFLKSRVYKEYPNKEITAIERDSLTV
ncbi:AAA domain-containing protein [Moritella yayanosii]|uniref:Phospholipase D/transphosphatidylase n=1 Tax=Moritella yayanosii TaxID=69539 RepID=A0A330LRR6_9GAMM|nr:AAA domain-containing protein [Moritella yayanosii]SQD76795.1 Phospholipase D/transphosphatidylase [Moritella yayanosii]